jgi:predicted nuclease of restriction endonuclease-like (RecB) superfamily
MILSFVIYMKQEIQKNENSLIDEIKGFIHEAKQTVAITTNSTLTILYWNIGYRINNEMLQNKRADYGKQIVRTLSKKLTEEFGKGWSEKQLRHCLRFAETFKNREIVYALSRQLTWTHFRTFIYLENELSRNFYAEMCRIEGWTTRVLSEKIDSMLFERTAISRKPENQIRKELKELRENKKVTPDLVFRDPYILDFLGLHDDFSERNLEEAILRELEKFILELGQGFTFVERQKRMLIDGESHKLDLLFYHRKLKRLVAIDLKLGRFKAAYKGQMELYLRYIQKYELEPGEDLPLGLLLCTEGNHEQIELLQLENSGIRVAEYITELPPKEILQKKLHKLIRMERARLKSSDNNL